MSNSSTYKETIQQAVAAFVGAVPVQAFDQLYHVGNLCAPPPEKHTGYEGPCLAVSLHPDEWTRIARLGGNPVWTVRAKGRDIVLYDMLAMTPEVREAAVVLAEQIGLIAVTDCWRAWFYDEFADECGDCEGGNACVGCSTPDGWGFFETKTEAEARAEVGAEGEEGMRTDGGPLVERVIGYTPSPELCRWWNGCSVAMTTRGTIDAALVYLLSSYGNCDGVWWDEQLNPEVLSAPRGGIFQERLAAMTASARVEIVPEGRKVAGSPGNFKKGDPE